MTVVLIVLALFLLFLSFRIALPLALGLAIVLYATFDGSLPINIIWQTFFSAFDSFTLLAIPFFILAGELMVSGGISNRLVRLALAFFGTISGSLGIVTVICCMFFAAVSGSAPATVAAIGAILMPAMFDEGYDKGFAVSLTACAGAMGPIIPPSILFIIYGVIAETSVSSLFLAGIIPGIIMALILCLYVYFVSKKKGFGQHNERTAATKQEKFSALKGAIWSLLLPVIILGSIYAGIATPTEVSVIACLYALIVGICIHKELKLRDLPSLFIGTACTTGYCLVSLGAASAFAKLLTMNGVPTMLADGISSITDNRIFILLIINVLLLIAGCFIEPIPAIIIFAPLLLPLATNVGVDPIHFGTMMVVNLTIGMCTPPVGVNLFVASGISGVPVHQMFKWLIPALGCLIIALLFVTFVPALSTALPSLL